MPTLFSNVSLPKTRRTREQLMLDLRTLARDAEHLLDATAHDMSGRTREAREHLAAVIGRVKETCNRLRERGMESTRDVLQQSDHLVHANPYSSMALAFGIGVLVGWLLRRPR